MAEIHGAPLAVCEPAIVQNLEQDIEDIRMSFLYLVKEDNAVRTAPHALREIAAFVVAHISGRRADEAGDGVFFHKLAHIQAQHGFLAVEKIGCQGLGEFGLSHSGGAQKDE